MNEGAKVPVKGVLPRFEFDRIRVESLRVGAGPVGIGEKDWCLWWTMPPGGESGDEMIVDFGRALLLGDGAGEGDAEALLNGFVRHLGPFCAGALIM